ncbi:MAG: hypothetical protein RLZZ324_1076 [Candidatus Parcubacteria bacterium]|jgi:hypothetical protein
MESESITPHTERPPMLPPRNEGPEDLSSDVVADAEPAYDRGGEEVTDDQIIGIVELEELVATELPTLPDADTVIAPAAPIGGQLGGLDRMLKNKAHDEAQAVDLDAAPAPPGPIEDADLAAMDEELQAKIAEKDADKNA